MNRGKPGEKLSHARKKRMRGCFSAGGSAGRHHPAKTHRHWDSGRLADRVFRPGCRRCDLLRDQPTNPSKAHQEQLFRDACESLSPAAHFWNPVERKRGESQGRTGNCRATRVSKSPPTFACRQSVHRSARHRAIWSNWCGKARFWRSSRPNCIGIMKKNGGFVEVQYFVGVPDGI
jgi:hypothetical protein